MKFLEFFYFMGAWASALLTLSDIDREFLHHRLYGTPVNVWWMPGHNLLVCLLVGATRILLWPVWLLVAICRNHRRGER